MEEARATRTEAMSGLAHRPRSGGPTHGRALTGVLTNGTATRGREGRPRGPKGGEGTEEPLLGDPWGAYKKSQQGPLETQRSNWSDQHWQRLPSPTEEPNPVRQPGRRGPRWEQMWWEGKSHPEMRFGGWRCGNAPACRYPNHAYRDTCRQCEAPKANTKWEFPQDPRTTTCACGAIIMSHCTKNCRTCQAPILRPDGGAAGTIPTKTSFCRPPAEVEICKAIPRSPSCSGRKRSSNPPDHLRSVATGRRFPTCTTSSPTTRDAWASRCRTPLRTTWRGHGVWTTVPYVASSWATGDANGETRTSPALLPLAHGELALCAAGGGPHAGLVRPAQCLQWDPGGRKHHPRHVEARGQDAGLPNIGVFEWEEIPPFVSQWPDG